MILFHCWLRSIPSSSSSNWRPTHLFDFIFMCWMCAGASQPNMPKYSIERILFVSLLFSVCRMDFTQRMEEQKKNNRNKISVQNVFSGISIGGESICMWWMADVPRVGLTTLRGTCVSTKEKKKKRKRKSKWLMAWRQWLVRNAGAGVFYRHFVVDVRVMMYFHLLYVAGTSDVETLLYPSLYPEPNFQTHPPFIA